MCKTTRLWRKKKASICVLKNLNGASWDETEKTIVMGEDEASTYKEAHPDAEGLLYKPIPYYEELSSICGSDVATDEHATGEDVAGVEGVGEDTGSQGAEPSTSLGGYDGMSVSNRSRGKSVVRTSKDDIAAIFVSALALVANVMKASQEEPRKLARGLNVALDELVGETFAFTKFDADSIEWANDYLVEKLS